MKKISLWLLVLVMCLFCGCGKEKAPSGKVELNKTEIEITVGQTEKLKLSSEKEVKWSCEDENIVRVLYGAVTGLREGETNVIATSDGKSYKCRVRVNADETQSKPDADASSTPEEREENSKPQDNSKPPVVSNESVTSSGGDESGDDDAQITEYLKEKIHKKIDEEFDKKIADFTAESDEAIAEVEFELDSMRRERDRLNEEKPDLGSKVYDEKIKEIEKEVENLRKIKAEGIELYNKQRAEEKENWEEYVLIVE